jgi:hypothetical protein
MQAIKLSEAARAYYWAYFTLINEPFAWQWLLMCRFTVKNWAFSMRFRLLWGGAMFVNA